MTSSWSNDDDFLNDMFLLSFCKKTPAMESKTTNYEMLMNKSKHKSIYDDDSDMDEKDNNCIPVRGRNVLTNIKAPSGKLIFMEHVKDTKAAIREAALGNYSNEYIEQTLKCNDVVIDEEEETENAKVDLAFKPISEDCQEQDTTSPFKPPPLKYFSRRVRNRRRAKGSPRPQS